MEGIIRIDKVVAEFDVWLDPGLCPFPKMKVKVLERSHDFAAFANVSRRDHLTREPEGMAGLGRTADEAFGNLLANFVSDIREHVPPEGLTEDDWEWSAPEDF